MRRVTWLVGLLVAFVGAGCGGDNGGPDPEPVVSEAHFAQSVASGDPTPESVVLWTRLTAPGVTGDAEVSLVVARDEALQDRVSERALTASAEHDHVVKVRVDGLEPARYYYYRFVWDEGDRLLASRTGRTKTAPAADADVTVRFAYLNCQDFASRWYNGHAHLLKQFEGAGPGEDLDFIAFLGDYIYETTGGEGERVVTFEDEAGAIDRGADLAAASLSNYRELYRTYRSDPMLRRLHERYPIIAIWDDHEFSDDSWGATATYFAGRVDEEDEARKRNGEQAFFEWLPIEAGLGADGTLAIGAGALYPNTRIYGAHRFGQHLEVLLTDTRTYRPDQLIPEDAFPGTIVLDAAAMGDQGIEPYVDIDAAELAALKAGLVQIVTGAYQAANEALDAAAAQARAEAEVTGNLSARYVNGLLAAAGQAPAFDEATLAALPRGLAYLTLGKQDLYSQFGSRYSVAQDAFAVYARALAAERGGPASLLGEGQQDWLFTAVEESGATWKVVGSSVSTASLILDFTNPQIAALLPAGFPEALKIRLQLNADHWEGFPLAREQLLNALSNTENVVVIAGDIHASFVADHGDRSALEGGGPHRVFDFTGPSASSETFGSFVAGAAEELGIEGTGPLVAVLPTLLGLSSRTSPASGPTELIFGSTSQYGYVVGVAEAAGLSTTYHLTQDVDVRRYDESFQQLDTVFETQGFRVEGGVLTRR